MKYTSAFVRQKPDTDKWVGYVRYKAPGGKWRQTAHTFPETVRTRKQAEKALQEWRYKMEAEASSGLNLPGAKTAVGEYVSAFIDDLEASKNVEARTVTGYRTIAKRIVKGFPNVSMGELTATMVQKWENGLSESGLAPATVTSYHRLLSEACKHAVSVDILRKNPCDAVRTPKRQPPKPNALDAEGYARLVATLDALEPEPVPVAALIAVHTGMRQGEICALRWRDYDATSGLLYVREAIGTAKGGSYIKQPKTETSRRILPVSVELANALIRRFAYVMGDLMRRGVEMKPKEFGELFIIGYVDGRFLTPNAIAHRWHAMARRYGLIGTQGRAVTFHDLRHSFATQAIAAGADVKAVSAILGHANAAMTLNIYADAAPDSKRRASELISGSVKEIGPVEPYAIELPGE